MGPSAATRPGLVEGASVGVAGEEHVAGVVCDTIVGVGGDVIKELGDGSVGVLGGGGLLGADSAERHKEFVTNGSAIPEESAYNVLDAFDAGGVKRGAGVWGGGVLHLSTILDGSVIVWRKLWLGGCGMAILD